MRILPEPGASLESLAQISEERRPGITELARTISAAHSKWNVLRVMHEAKRLYTTRPAPRSTSE